MTCKNILQILAQTTDALGLSYMRAFPLCTLGKFEYILHPTLVLLPSSHPNPPKTKHTKRAWRISIMQEYKE